MSYYGLTLQCYHLRTLLYYNFMHSYNRLILLNAARCSFTYLDSTCQLHCNYRRTPTYSYLSSLINTKHPYVDSLLPKLYCILLCERVYHPIRYSLIQGLCQYLIVGIDKKRNGNHILHTAKHNLNYSLCEKSRLKCTSNTINNIALL